MINVSMLVIQLLNVANIFVSTHDAEQPVKVLALFFRIHSVAEGGCDLTGWGQAPFAALTALTLQLGVASQAHSRELI